MNRKYTISEFDELIGKLSARNDVFIATDIIVGFPTETDVITSYSIHYTKLYDW